MTSPEEAQQSRQASEKVEQRVAAEESAASADFKARPSERMKEGSRQKEEEAAAQDVSRQHQNVWHSITPKIQKVQCQQ